MTLFTRFVEPGRLCRIQYGPDTGKMCFIVDVINMNRVLIDGPTTEVSRQSIPLRRLGLTDFKVKIPRGARTGTIKKILDKDSSCIDNFNKTTYGQKCAAKVFKANMTDFERHALLVARKKRQFLVKQILKTKKN
ncbi:ribosomal protein L14 [Cryptosporidium canis]|uniref:Ribosomal protein L14 n=1 Tax=Cryptosporidium canis TaxID=195482 RepID=A0ABQ8P5I1_9CRYT|nr:ribosomal protein L14 [Cryptosporidium canis]KAJ1609035.1 ribosomal protein L14 [Cryptosporidium canis]